MREIKLRNFKNIRTGETTSSFETANKWFEKQDVIKCCGSNERGTFMTSPIQKFDIDAQSFSTSSGTVYKVMGMDDCIKEIIVNCFFSDDGTIMDTLLEVSSALDEGRNVRCNFTLLSGGKLGETSYIKSVDVTNSRFVTESGSIYVIPNP